MGVVKLSEYRHGTNRFVCQNPVSESEVCVYAWELAVPDAGHSQGTETAPPAETPETQAEAGLPSRPRPWLRRPNRTATVLSVRGDHQ